MKLTVGSVGAVRGRIVYGTLAFEKHVVPVAIAGGTRAGPVLTAIGMQHTNEFSGPAAMDRVLADLRPARMKGTLICLPFVNPLQLRLSEAEFRTAWKNPDRNMNRQWPGDAHSANPLSRLAALIWREALSKSDAVLDYHCCRAVDPRFAACLEGHRASEALAVAMGLEAVDLQTAASYARGLLIVAAAEQLDVPAVLVESHPARFQVREAVETCADSLWHAMAHLGMIERREPVSGRPKSVPVFRRGQAGHSIKARAEGYLGVRRWPGDRVRRGTVAAELRSLHTFEPIQTLRSPLAGAVGCMGAPDGGALTEKGMVVAGIKPVQWRAQ